MSPINEPIIINGVTVQPGERQVIDVPVAKLHTHISLNIPVQVICGKRPGPRSFISAAIHGDELNGIEIVRRLFTYGIGQHTEALNRANLLQIWPILDDPETKMLANAFLAPLLLNSNLRDGS